MIESLRRLGIRVQPLLLVALAIIVAACQKANGGSGPGY
jgi:hypothetical protein